MCNSLSIFLSSVPCSPTCAPACANGGTCVTENNGESRCDCPLDYIGSDCSEAISCTSDDQCQANRTCKVYQSQNYCDCGDELTGFFCNFTVSNGESSLSFIDVEGLIVYTRGDTGHLPRLDNFWNPTMQIII